jgi:hypothetical protein
VAPPGDALCRLDAVEVRLMTVAPDAVTTVQVVCGEMMVGEVVHPCAMVSAWNERDAMVSETVNRDYPQDGCVPVSEPSVHAGLAACVIALAAIRWWRGAPRT